MSIHSRKSSRPRTQQVTAQSTTKRATKQARCVACEGPPPQDMVGNRSNRHSSTRGALGKLGKHRSTVAHPMLIQTTAYPAPWLQELRRQAVPSHTQKYKQLLSTGFAPTYPSDADVCVRYTGVDLPKKVLYWASGGGSVNNPDVIKSAECSYGKYKNMGVAVRKGKTLEFVLRTPRPYVARQQGKKSQQLWCRHLHFVPIDETTNQVVTEATNMNRLYTLAVFPCTLLDNHTSYYTCKPLGGADRASAKKFSSMFLTFEQYLKGTADGAVGINAISDETHPPIQSDDLVVSWKTPSKKIQTLLESSSRCKEHGIHTPLIVYCAHDKCMAAQALIEKLCDIGYCNVFYFKHGMREALCKLKPMQNFVQTTHINTE